MIDSLTFRRPALLAALILFTLFSALPANAAPAIAEVNSTTIQTYAGDASDADLLHGITPVTTGWNTSNNASPLELTDGIHGAGFDTVTGDKVQGAWTTVGATAEYHLGLGSSGAGYDISSVQSIADWQGSGFGNQAWTLEVKPVGGSYTTLATVDYQPLGTGGGTTKVTLTDPGGVLASGIESVKVTANQVNGGANAGAFVWRELDVFGVPTNDNTAPQLASLSPADNSTGVSPSTNLVATFDENIALGTGTIAIRDLDTPADTLITLPDARVTVSGAQMVIDPAIDLSASTSYAIRIAATAVTDLAGNPYAGIDNDTLWNFTTGQPDLTAPVIVSLSPADDATAVSLSSNLLATFDEDIAVGSGNITIKNLDAASQTVITLPDARVSVSGAVLTINPDSNFATTSNYAVRIDLDAVTDLFGNPFAGIADDTTWNFATAAAPLRIMPMGDSITVGYTNADWTGGAFEFGYRSGLYTLLTQAGYDFQFVGSSTEPWTFRDPVTTDPAWPPAINLADLGQDGHNGYGGQSASFLNSNISSWLAADDPDIILLKIGTNSQDKSGLQTLVDTITTTKPDCHLIIAQIMPKYSYQQGIVDYNTWIRDTLVPAQQAQGRKVTLVDQYAPFLTNPADLTTIDQSLFSNGINHPSNPGYDKMAQVWFDAIKALGIGPSNYSSWISNSEYGLEAADQDPGDDPDGDGIANAIEAWFGTNPAVPDSGLAAFRMTGSDFIFTHPRNQNPPVDLIRHYEWSADLKNWYPGGGGPVGSPTITFTPIDDGGLTTVTAQASEPVKRLFIRMAVTR